MKYFLIKNRTENHMGEKLVIRLSSNSKHKSPIDWIKTFRPDWTDCNIYSEPEFLAMVNEKEFDKEMKKLIDIDDNTFKELSHMAVDAGTDLKKFIESILVEKAKVRMKKNRNDESKTKKGTKGKIK